METPYGTRTQSKYAKTGEHTKTITKEGKQREVWREGQPHEEKQYKSANVENTNKPQTEQLSRICTVLTIYRMQNAIIIIIIIITLREIIAQPIRMLGHATVTVRKGKYQAQAI